MMKTVVIVIIIIIIIIIHFIQWYNGLETKMTVLTLLSNSKVWRQFLLCNVV